MFKVFYKNIVNSTFRGFDNLFIFVQKLRPSTHFKNLRIIELNEGEINDGDNVCIFIIYERLTIPAMTWNAINVIKNMGIKVFVVVNSKLEIEEKAKIRELSDISMFRNNTGKDIGAYKDAYLHLLEKGNLRKINRLIFANDSVVYPVKFINPIFEKLINSGANFVGYSHVQEIHYHIQSFLFSCDNTLINDQVFIKFWNKYLPVDRRRFMIHKGEIGISKAVIKAGKTIEVINTIAEILNHDIGLNELIDLTYSLPTRAIQNSSLELSLKNLNDRFHISIPKAFKHINLESNLYKLKDFLEIEEYKKNLCNFYIKELVNEVAYRNNTHWNTFLFLKLKKPVVIKRDSVFRAGYDFDYFISYLDKYLPNDRNEIMLMMKPPASTHFKGIKRIMFDNGII